MQRYGETLSSLQSGFKPKRWLRDLSIGRREDAKQSGGYEIMLAREI